MRAEERKLKAVRSRFSPATALVQQPHTAKSAPRPDVARRKSLRALGTVMIVAPHPDDETLGCGGLIAACADLSVPVVIVAVTNGEACHPQSRQWTAQKLAQLRRREQQLAMQALGHARPIIVSLNLPDGRVAKQPRPVLDRAESTLLQIVREVGPVSLFVTAPTDDHPDHRASARLVKGVDRHVANIPVFYYQIWPGKKSAETRNRTLRGELWALDVDAALVRKADAIACYRSQRGEVVGDDPDGFRMPDHLIARALSSPEFFTLATRAHL